jgi:hypothetical protein
LIKFRICCKRCLVIFIFITSQNAPRNLFLSTVPILFSFFSCLPLKECVACQCLVRLRLKFLPNEILFPFSVTFWWSLVESSRLKITTFCSNPELLKFLDLVKKNLHSFEEWSHLFFL